MRRVLDGGDGVISGGKSDKSSDNGDFAPDVRRLDVSDDGDEVCIGWYESEFGMMTV